VLGQGLGIAGGVFLDLPDLGGLISSALQGVAGLIFADCDGVPVNDVLSTSSSGQTLNGADLLNLTGGAGGVYSETRSYTGPNTNHGCGNNAQYDVT